MATLDLSKALSAAREAAAAAGALLAEGYGRPHDIRLKGAVDLVTEVDLKSEKVISEIILDHFPGHALVGEEGGAQGAAASPWRWYIDPLDGTTNYAHGHPFFCCSLALWGPDSLYPEPGGTFGPLLGVVSAPILGQDFWALQGQGAHLGERPLNASPQEELGQALLGTGFPYDFRSRPEPVIEALKRLALRAQGLRRGGSAALDLAYVAQGVLDGFWEAGLKPWDTAAGLFLVLEAGGRVSDYLGRPYRLEQSRDIVAAGPLLQPQICAIISRP